MIVILVQFLVILIVQCVKVAIFRKQRIQLRGFAHNGIANSLGGRFWSFCDRL